MRKSGHSTVGTTSPRPSLCKELLNRFWQDSGGSRVAMRRPKWDKSHAPLAWALLILCNSKQTQVFPLCLPSTVQRMCNVESLSILLSIT